MPTEEKLLLKPMVHQARSYQWLVVPLATRGVHRHLIYKGWTELCLDGNLSVLTQTRDTNL